MSKKKFLILKILILLISSYLSGCTQDDDNNTTENRTKDHQKTEPQDDSNNTDTKNPQQNSDHFNSNQKPAPPKPQKINSNQIRWPEETFTQLQTLEESTLQKVERLFQDTDSSFSIQKALEDTDQIIAEIEPQVRQIVKTDTQQKVDDQKELSIQRTILEIEQNAYSYYTTKLNNYLQKTANHSLNEALSTLKRNSEESKKAMENVNMEPVFHESNPYKRFQKNVTEVAQQKIKNKYTRTELGVLRGVLEKEEFTSPEEDPYQFVSPDGRFLYKLQSVYGKLRNANPYHEQGILARECGLQSVILGDQEFLNGNKEKAQEEYNSAQSLTKIVLGELPLGKEREIYQKCTGKDLLTGAFLKN